MELDTPLLVLAIVSAAVITVRSLRSRPLALDWLAVAGLVFVTAALVGVFFPRWVGAASFAVWFLLGWVPVLLSRAIQAAMERLRYQLAYRLAWVVYGLHPTPPLRQQVERWRVHVLEQLGLKREAVAAIARLAEHKKRVYAGRPEAALIEETLALLRLEGRYPEIDTMLAAIPDSAVRANPTLLALMTRLDLELGQRERAFDRYARLEILLQAPAFAYARVTTRLALLAMAGRERGVEQILGAQLSGFAPELKELWRATAALCASRADARERLHLLAESPDAVVRSAALARVRVADELASGSLDRYLAIVDRIERQLDVESRYLTGSRTASQPRGTWAIAAVLAAMFLAETLAGGSTDYITLSRLGALEPSAVLEQYEGYRLVAFMFLHYGFAHLAFNALGLLVIGPFVERALGIGRYLGVYLFSGLAGGLLMVMREYWFRTDLDLMVGASGCIMGLVGASAAILLRGFRRERVAIAKRRFYVFLLIVVLQSIVDFQIPEISFFAHAVGAVVGFLVTLLLAHPGIDVPPARVSLAPR